MTEINPYRAYTDDSILNSSPLGLVIALYEGAIESSVAARKCLASRDILGRTKAINKIIGILTELMYTLNDEKGGEVSKNLRRLYIYIQSRVLDAHLHQKPSPLEETEKLFGTLLEGWKEANMTFNSGASVTGESLPVPLKAPTSHESHSYGDSGASYSSYLSDSMEYSATSAYAF